MFLNDVSIISWSDSLHFHDAWDYFTFPLMIITIWNGHNDSWTCLWRHSAFFNVVWVQMVMKQCNVAITDMCSRPKPCHVNTADTIIELQPASTVPYCQPRPKIKPKPYYWPKTTATITLWMTLHIVTLSESNYQCHKPKRNTVSGYAC